MKLDWIIIAEGLGTDAQGRLTAIGIDQTVLIAPELPTSTKRAIIAHLVEEEAKAVQPGTNLQFSLAIRSPSGKVISAQTGAVSVGEKRFPNLPGTITIPAEFGIAASEYGTYEINVALSLPGGDEISDSVALYVVRPHNGQAPY